MIVSFHVASGAAVGALTRSRVAALVLGLASHVAGDRVPHQDTGSPPFELYSGLAGVALLAVTRGFLDPSVIGAAAAACPDIEHLVPSLRFRGRKLFPSHRFRGWHRAGGIPVTIQLLAAGTLLGALAARRR